jgi:hypothetical protein
MARGSVRLRPLATAFALAAGCWFAPFCAGAQTPARPNWTPFEWLVGSWVADIGSGGQPGMATRGGETWALDLDRRVIIRRDYSDYPPTADRPAAHHEGMMVIAPLAGGGYSAHAYDNEGHNIDYDVAVGESTEVFTSRAVSGEPRFRLTYTRSVSGVDVKFEIAPPNQPGGFRVYVTGSMQRAP